MTKRLDRIFQLLDFLVEGRCNIHGLTVELRVCQRQVYRDIRELRSVGFDIEINPRTGNYELYGPVTLPRTRREHG